MERTLGETVGILRRAGLEGTARLARDRLLHVEEVMLGLRCDLSALPEVRPAKVPLVMERTDPLTFTAFTRARATAHGGEVMDLLDREQMCRADVRDLYAARTPDGQVAYTQWCVRPGGLAALLAVTPGRYRTLTEDEVLLEGAFTFATHRGIGAMNDGMGQLLRLAAAAGATTAWTYVGAGNVASLKGCARVGFTLDHARVDRSTVGRRRSEFRETDDADRRAWSAATSTGR